MVCSAGLGISIGPLTSHCMGLYYMAVKLRAPAGPAFFGEGAEGSKAVRGRVRVAPTLVNTWGKRQNSPYRMATPPSPWAPRRVALGRRQAPRPRVYLREGVWATEAAASSRTPSFWTFPAEGFFWERACSKGVRGLGRTRVVPPPRGGDPCYRAEEGICRNA